MDGGEFQRSQVCRSEEEVLRVTAAWKAAMSGKGWHEIHSGDYPRDVDTKDSNSCALTIATARVLLYRREDIGVITIG